jgi:hypothetical protein
MKNFSSRRVVGTSAVLLAAAFVLGYCVSRARASGVPATGALTYSGVLTDTAGAPLTGSKSILVQFYDAGTAGNTLCTIGPSMIPLVAGAFQVQLPEACTTAVHANPDIWVDVFVDGASVGRAKLGAVPYALESAAAARLLLKKGTQTLSVGPYCGSSAATAGSFTAAGGLTGYPAARALCVTACSSPTAHMCSGVEMTWTAQMGIALPALGWVATGALGSPLPTGGYPGDCQGWLNGTASQSGGLFGPSGYFANYSACNASYPILCCD